MSGLGLPEFGFQELRPDIWVGGGDSVHFKSHNPNVSSGFSELTFEIPELTFGFQD